MRQRVPAAELRPGDQFDRLSDGTVFRVVDVVSSASGKIVNIGMVVVASSDPMMPAGRHLRWGRRAVTLMWIERSEPDVDQAIRSIDYRPLHEDAAAPPVGATCSAWTPASDGGPLTEVGSMTIRFPGTGAIYVDRVEVLPELQGAGLGRALFARVIEENPAATMILANVATAEGDAYFERLGELYPQLQFLVD